MKFGSKKTVEALRAELQQLRHSKAELVHELTAVADARDRAEAKFVAFEEYRNETESMRAGYEDLRAHAKAVQADLSIATGGGGTFAERADFIGRQLKALHEDAYRAGEREFASKVRSGLRALGIRRA